METRSYEQLISGANKIKYNELPESNTAALVGEQLLQMVNKQQEENRQRASEDLRVNKELEKCIQPVILTEEEFDNLPQKDEKATYFVYEE